MSENTMTLNVGLNLLYPTVISKSKIILDDDKVLMPAIERNEITDTLKEIMEMEFDDYLASQGMNLDDWGHYQLKSWVNKYEHGHPGMEAHTHAGSHLSAIVILEAGEGGEIVFYDPRGFASRGYDLRFRPMFEPTVYQPEQGDVLIIPSFLYHSVRPTKQLRLSAAFDLYLYNDI